MLQDYRHDYLERLQQAMTSGMSASDCHNTSASSARWTMPSSNNRALQQADENLNKGRLYYQQEKRKLILRRAGATRAARRSRRRIAPNSA